MSRYHVCMLSVDGTSKMLFDQPKPNLRFLQEVVGGLIEPIDQYIYSMRVIAYANERGRLLNMEPNPIATAICKFPYSIVGPTVFFWKTTNKKATEYFGAFK